MTVATTDTDTSCRLPPRCRRAPDLSSPTDGSSPSHSATSGLDPARQPAAAETVGTLPPRRPSQRNGRPTPPSAARNGIIPPGSRSAARPSPEPLRRSPPCLPPGRSPEPPPALPAAPSPARRPTPPTGSPGIQTFPFRHGWFAKAAAAIHEDPALFARPDALARLGVGKNMVASIRHWCAAAGLIRFAAGARGRTPRDRGREARLTDLGTLLLGAGPTSEPTYPPPPPEITGTPLSPVAERR